MDSTQISLLVLGFVFCISVQSVAGGKCYVCNSAAKYEGKKCEEPAKYKDELLRDCGDTKNNYCRKLSQTVEGDYRIVRDCATLVREDGFKCVERTGTAKVKITYCECDGNECNAANVNLIAPILLIFAMIFSIKQFLS